MRFDFRWNKIWIALVAIFVFIQLVLFTPLWSRVQSHVPSFTTPVLRKPLRTPADLPPDYLRLSPNDEWCESTFGRSYLDFLASHQLPYCKSGSNSGLQCFRTNRTDGMYSSDSLCIAQGVVLDSTSEKAFSLQCQLRNFTAEAQAGNKEVEGVQNVEDMHSYYFWTGVTEQLKEWKIQGNDNSGCGKESLDKKWILLAKREENVNIWHKLAELWQATISLDIVQMATDSSTANSYLTPEEDVSVQVVFEDDRDEPLNEWWTAVSGTPPIRKSQLDPGCYGNVILPLAGSSSPFWMLIGQSASKQVCRSTLLIDAFLRRIFRHLRIEPRRTTVRDPVITIIDRKTTRKIFNIGQYTENLRQKYPNLKINLVDFAALSLREQVLLIQDTDILIGHHGAGMTHVLFLPERSAVIEILPPTFSAGGFAQLSKMREHSYFSINSVWVGDWEKETNTSNGIERPPWDEGGWQSEEWVYIREKDFQSLVNAALWSRNYRGVG